MELPARQQIVLVTGIALMANIVDVASTYAASPDLASEWNILQRHFGLGWWSLLLAKAIGVLFVGLGYRYYLQHRDGCFPPPGYSLRAFMHYLTFGPRLTPPDNGRLVRHLLVNVGYFWAGVQALVLWVAVDNMLLCMGHVWEVRHVSEGGYHLVQSALVGSLAMARFYLGNYRRYQQSALAVAAQPAAGGS